MMTDYMIDTTEGTTNTEYGGRLHTIFRPNWVTQEEEKVHPACYSVIDPFRFGMILHSERYRV